MITRQAIVSTTDTDVHGSRPLRGRKQERLSRIHNAVTCCKGFCHGYIVLVTSYLRPSQMPKSREPVWPSGKALGW